MQGYDTTTSRGIDNDKAAQLEIIAAGGTAPHLPRTVGSRITGLFSQQSAASGPLAAWKDSCANAERQVVEQSAACLEGSAFTRKRDEGHAPLSDR